MLSLRREGADGLSSSASSCSSDEGEPETYIHIDILEAEKPHSNKKNRNKKGRRSQQLEVLIEEQIALPEIRMAAGRSRSRVNT